jgi:antitoxin (DNA-binding transcriptional repressor) of toxin-antitoxin stability system
METYTVDQFKENWEELISRVESGESFIIKDGNTQAVIVPFKETINYALESLEPVVDEELIHIHTDHEEGS